MNHLVYNPTPIVKLPYFSKKFGCNLICKRDDLFGDTSGGSKARMLQYILADVSNDTFDVLVTAGGPCSNFNRVCALSCAKLGLPMHLIEYTDNLDEWESLNYYICKLAGIRTTRCKKSEVVQTINDTINSYISLGKRVKSIYGGGRSVEGIYAYYDAIKELCPQMSHIDYVFVACSTGTTVTGICAGMQEFYPNAKVYAISTARTYDVEKLVLEENLKLLNNYLHTQYNLDNLFFLDTFLCGGYGVYSNELFEVVKECISREGMVVDPTYSGKAFYGMSKLLESNLSKFKDKTVLFWNTGGFVNLLSTKI